MMQRSTILALSFLVIWNAPTHFVHSQNQARKPDGWVDVLRNDPRLKAKVSYLFPPRPTAEAVLGSVQKATGVPLSLAAQPEKCKLIFGTTSAGNMPAWIVMQQLANNQIVDGKWEKVADGYVLHGRQLDFGDPPDAVKAKPASEAELAVAAAQREKFPLRMDPMLRAKVSVVGSTLQLADLLEQLRTATGLSMTLADNLTYHDPKFGVVKLPDASAWMVMGLIAETDLDDGRWEKIEGGYRLEGVSRSLRPGAPKPFPWAWTAIGLALTLMAAGAFVMFRGRGKKPSKRK